MLENKNMKVNSYANIELTLSLLQNVLAPIHLLSLLCECYTADNPYHTIIQAKQITTARITSLSQLWFRCGPKRTTSIALRTSFCFEIGSLIPSSLDRYALLWTAIRGRARPSTRFSWKTRAYCGRSTQSTSHDTVSSTVQLWTVQHRTWMQIIQVKLDYEVSE